MIKTCKDIKKYHQLSIEEKLKTYLDEKTAHNIKSIKRKEPVIDIRRLKQSQLLRFHDDLKDYNVRKTLGIKLINIAKKLYQDGFYLEVYELFRSNKKQRKHFNEIMLDMKCKYPNYSQEKIWDETTKYIADPDLTPPHGTGGAVDVRILRQSDLRPIDMGNEINSTDQKSNIYTKGISLKAKHNRNKLLKLFLEEECAPMATEWWHFSYGEKYWAAFYNTTAIFDVIK